MLLENHDHDGKVIFKGDYECLKGKGYEKIDF